MFRSCSRISCTQAIRSRTSAKSQAAPKLFDADLPAGGRRHRELADRGHVVALVLEIVDTAPVMKTATKTPMKLLVSEMPDHLSALPGPARNEMPITER